MKIKKTILITFAVLITSLGILFFVNNGKITSLIPKQLKKVTFLSFKKTYPSLREAVQAANYLKYPASAFLVPTEGGNHTWFNPVTNTQLELDTSEGGGYVCCEAPTFYAWVDRKDDIFWVRIYQASLNSVSDHWYGPFKIQK